MATEQYMDLANLELLLTLIKNTYVCQTGFNNKVREEIQEQIADLNLEKTVKQTYADDRTDPNIIAADFKDHTWSDGDLLCVENTAGHMSVFYWFKNTWICISKAPVNEIDIDDTPAHLKGLIPTAAAVIKTIDKKIENISGTQPSVDVDIATSEKAGIVAPSADEFKIDPITGQMVLNNISVNKVTNFSTEVKTITQEEIRKLVYSKEEIDQKLDNIAAGETDLSNYYTKEEVHQLLILNTNHAIESSGEVASKEELPTENIAVGTIYSVTDPETGKTIQFCYAGDGIDEGWVQVAEEAGTDTWDTF